MNIIIINGVTLETILGVLVAWAKAILLHAIAVIVIIAVIALVLLFEIKEQIELVDKEKHNVVL